MGKIVFENAAYLELWGVLSLYSMCKVKEFKNISVYVFISGP